MTMVRELRTGADPMIRLKSTPVSVFTPGLSVLAQDLVDTMQHHGGLGISAVQVGFPYRVCVVRHEGKPLVLVNPRAIGIFYGYQDVTEGCLSFPGLRVKKRRAWGISIVYNDVSGAEHTVSLSTIDAAIAQHELDHLDGTVLADEIGRKKSSKKSR